MTESVAVVTAPFCAWHGHGRKDGDQIIVFILSDLYLYYDGLVSVRDDTL